MRVISGRAKGIKLLSLEGEFTRPTLDRVKESIFGSIQFYLKNSVCLDIFAGSGSLGIEAISRGALHVDFCDNSKLAVEIIKNNIKKTHFQEFSNVFLKDAFSFISDTNKKYDFVFIDPPYGNGLVIRVIIDMIKYKRVSEKTCFVCEHEAELLLPNTIGDFKIFRQKKFSKTVTTIYKVIRN